MKKIILVVGARPNFMKAAPLYRHLRKQNNLNVILLHTGQHYDYEMSQIFFEDLDLPKPDYFLDVQSGSHAKQTAKIMVKFEKVLLKEKPDMVVVFGDVNSTVACSLTAKKMQIVIAHVEAGLRSYDETMPEEINRRVTDSISDLLLTPSEDANVNLLKEGVDKEKIFLVGNIMIDSLVVVINKIKDETKILKKLKLEAKEYCLVTIHRPSNVDNEEILAEIVSKLNEVSEKIPVVFPVHPRTRKHLQDWKIKIGSKILLTSPLGYRDFTCLERNSRLVITDSGGIQEETTFLNIPCLTLRPNTERPITIQMGTNKLVTEKSLLNEVEFVLNNNNKKGKIPALWDGKTALRISEILIQKLLVNQT
ncbi:MAG: UDP-N-acetylglucosamine 2-epimerase (non-hydrolyzing) [Candidatus Daviesbacteria bacterium]|nr:UDP-N-acetylglucosamine 2-epimerase (non-hydrolyzing) [Candidatus Daviesbacteria bacterium]